MRVRRGILRRSHDSEGDEGTGAFADPAGEDQSETSREAGAERRHPVGRLASWLGYGPEPDEEPAPQWNEGSPAPPADAALPATQEWRIEPAAPPPPESPPDDQAEPASEPDEEQEPGLDEGQELEPDDGPQPEPDEEPEPELFESPQPEPATEQQRSDEAEDTAAARLEELEGRLTATEERAAAAERDADEAHTRVAELERELAEAREGAQESTRESAEVRRELELLQAETDDRVRQAEDRARREAEEAAQGAEVERIAAEKDMLIESADRRLTEIEGRAIAAAELIRVAEQELAREADRLRADAVHLVHDEVEQARAGLAQESAAQVEPEPSGEPDPALEAPDFETDDLEQPQELRAPPMGPLDLSSAGFDDLRALGLSVTQAKRILDFRERLGGFESVDDLDRVPGFPRSLLADLKARVTV